MPMNVREAKAYLRELVPGFARTVQPIYQMLCWEWEQKNTKHVPQVSDIEECLYSLIDGLDRSSAESATGGLIVIIRPANEFDLCDKLVLEFRLQHVYIRGHGGYAIHRDALEQG